MKGILTENTNFESAILGFYKQSFAKKFHNLDRRANELKDIYTLKKVTSKEMSIPNSLVPIL